MFGPRRAVPDSAHCSTTGRRFEPENIAGRGYNRRTTGVIMTKSASVSFRSWRNCPMQDVVDIQVTPLSAACGAEIKGVDLTKPLSEVAVEAIKDAWGKHLVLVFRGQKVSQDDQLRFATYFGDLGLRKKAPEKLRSRAEGIQQDHEKVLLVTNIKVDGQPIGAFGDGEFWFHIDSGYSARPYKYTFLYALELPAKGGNTLFSNMYEAYEAVPAALKERIRGRRDRKSVV